MKQNEVKFWNDWNLNYKIKTFKSKNYYDFNKYKLLTTIFFIKWYKRLWYI